MPLTERLGQLRKLAGVIQPVARLEQDPGTRLETDDPVTVVLDFGQPLIPLRRPVSQRGKRYRHV